MTDMYKIANTPILQDEKDNRYESEANTQENEEMPELTSSKPELSSSEAYEKIHSNIDGQKQIIDDFFYEFDRHNQSDDNLEDNRRGSSRILF